MRRRAGVALGLLLLATPAPAFALGGRYRGPTDEVPPEERYPEDWPPPETSGGQPAPPGPLAAHHDSWRFWWAFNGEALLGRGIPSRNPARIPREVAEERILPVLRALAEDETPMYEIPATAILSLAECGRSLPSPFLLDRARNEEGPGKVRHRKDVEEEATLALGLLEDPDSAISRALRDILAKPDAKFRTRCFAAVALSLREAGRPSRETLEALAALAVEAEGGRWTWPGHRLASFFALGRLGTPGASEVLLRALRGLRSTEGRNYDLLRAHAANALGAAAGASGDRDTAAAALSALEPLANGAARLPRQGAILGLGRLGARAGDSTAIPCVQILAGLRDAKSADSQALRYAAMALARIASGGAPLAREAALAALRERLPSGHPNPSWAALAIAVGARDRSEEVRSSLATTIREGLRPAALLAEEDGGRLLALGLLKDRNSLPLLTAILLNRESDPDLRRAAATALGLLGDPAALPPLRTTLAERRDRDPRREVIETLGLLGDAESVDGILAALRDPKTNPSSLGACAVALGRIGDPRCVEPLLAVARDGRSEYSDFQRAAAVVALGRLASSGRPDPLAALAEDVDWRAYDDFLGELLDLL